MVFAVTRFFAASAVGAPAATAKIKAAAKLEHIMRVIAFLLFGLLPPHSQRHRGT